MPYQQVDTVEALRRRRQRTPPGDTTTGFFFGSILDAVRTRRGPEALAPMLAGAGLSGRWTGLLRYPVRDYLTLLEAALLTLGGAAEFNDLLVQLGVDAAGTFRASPIGQVFERANAGAVHRVMAAARLAYSSTCSFGQRSYARLGEREGLLQAAEDWVGPAAALGAVLGGVTAFTGVAIQAQVEGVAEDGARYAIRVRW